MCDLMERLRIWPTSGLAPECYVAALSDIAAAADEIDRLRYVLEGVRGAILTGRNEPLQIWKDQIDLALGKKEPPST